MTYLAYDLSTKSNLSKKPSILEKILKNRKINFPEKDATIDEIDMQFVNSFKE
jgi:hypothetical protein